MYTLYGYPKTRAFRIVWALEELGLDYDYQTIDLKAGEHQGKAFKALSPVGKIPLLQTEHGVLSESVGIVQYLAHRHGAPLLPPSVSDAEYGRIVEMQSFMATELEQPLWLKAKHSFALPESQRVADVLATADWEYAKALEIFAQMLGERAFVAGEHFSYADIYAVHTLNWAKGSGFQCPYTNVNDYHQRLLARDGYQQAVAKEKQKLAELSA